MRSHQPGRLTPARWTTILVLGVFSGCHSPGQPQQPGVIRRTLRPLFADDPAGLPQPRKSLTLSNYAGYNYGPTRGRAIPAVVGP